MKRLRIPPHICITTCTFYTAWLRRNGVMGSLSRMTAALLFTYEPRMKNIQKKKDEFAVGLVYLHQHSLDASGKVALERMLAGNGVVLDLLQLLCVGLVGLLFVLCDDL